MAFLKDIAAGNVNTGPHNRMLGGQVLNSPSAKFLTPKYGVMLASIVSDWGPNPGATRMISMEGRFEIVCFNEVSPDDVSEIGDQAEYTQYIANDIALAICQGDDGSQMGGRFENAWISQDKDAVKMGLTDVHAGIKQTVTIVKFHYASRRDDEG